MLGSRKQKLSSRIYDVSELPRAFDWIYALNAPDAVQQCRRFGLTPKNTLTENRKLLSEFQYGLMTTNSTVNVVPQDTQPVVATPGALPAVSTGSLAQVGGSTPMRVGDSSNLPDNRTTTETTENSSGTHTVSTMTCTPPNQESQASKPPQPAWYEVIQSTALAVGTAVAQSLSISRQESGPSHESSKVFSFPAVLNDLVRGMSLASGSEPRQLITFLVQVNRIANLSLAEEHVLLLAILPRTTGQLRTIWSEAIVNRTQLSDLIGEVLDFFIPQRLRHSLVTELVHRAQRPNERLAEFVSDIREVAQLITPTFTPEDILEVALTGINQTTRSKLAGFPAPRTIQDLLALAPRIEVISLVESQAEAERGRHLTQPFIQNNHQQQDSRNNNQTYRSWHRNQRWGSRPSRNQQWIDQNRFSTPQQSRGRWNNNDRDRRPNDRQEFRPSGTSNHRQGNR